MRRIIGAGLVLLIIISSCGRQPDPKPEPLQPVALWDHKSEAQTWTSAALDALGKHGAPLVNLVPADIDEYCPTYPSASVIERKAFWVTFLSALAEHESTWRQDAVGGDGLWHGLLQIAPPTAKGYGCQAQTAEELHNGALNLSCGIRIMAVTVPRDGVISEGFRGVAADWGPFHQERKRMDIKATTRSQSYCK